MEMVKQATAASYDDNDDDNNAYDSQTPSPRNEQSEPPATHKKQTDTPYSCQSEPTDSFIARNVVKIQDATDVQIFINCTGKHDNNQRSSDKEIHISKQMKEFENTMDDISKIAKRWRKAADDRGVIETIAALEERVRSLERRGADLEEFEMDVEARVALLVEQVYGLQRK